MLLASAWGIIVGACIESFYTIPLYAPQLMLVVGVLFVICCSFRKGTLFLVAALFVIFCSCVIFRFHSEKTRMEYDHARFDVSEIIFEGIITRDPDVREKTKKVFVSDGTSTLLVTLSKDKPIEYGDRIRVMGTPVTPESFETNTGKLFDYPGYLAKDRIFFEMKYPNVEVLERRRGNPILAFLYKIKSAFTGRIDMLFRGERGGLLAGILLGEKDGLSEETKNSFIETGTIHIVALSGYNVTIVAEAITSVARKIVGYTAGVVFGITGIVLFALMTGLGATVFRASLMAILALIARAQGRTASMGRALLTAGGVMILINPWILVYDVSFQLSFLATLGLIYMTPITERWFTRVPKKGGLREAISTTLATNIVVLPFVAYKMGLASIISVPINLLIIPLIPYVMFGGFVSVMASFIAPIFGLPFALVTEKALGSILSLVDFGGRLPFASVAIPLIPLGIVMLVYGVIGYWAYANTYYTVQD